MSDIETIREALEAYVKVAKELYWEGWSSADRHAKLAPKALRLFDELAVAEPMIVWQEERPRVELTLEEIENIIKSNITITDPNLYEGVYAVAVGIEQAIMEKNK